MMVRQAREGAPQETREVGEAEAEAEVEGEVSGREGCSQRLERDGGCFGCILHAGHSGTHRLRFHP